MSYYSIISNSLFYIKENQGLVKSFNNDKLLLICDYLYTNTNRQGISIFILSDIITTYGFKPNSSKGKINDQFKSIMIEMVKKKYITILSKDIDIKNIKLNDLIKCKFNFVEKKDDKYIKFIQLFDDEKQKILNYSDEKIDNVKLLAYYCYLKARMYKRAKDDKMEIYGGKAETCYPSYNRIMQDINITENAINKYNNILVRLNLIRVGNAGLYYLKSDSNKKLYESSNVYTLLVNGDEATAQNNLKESIKLFKLEHEEDRVFTGNRKYKNNNRKINGYKGRIKYLMEQGKASDEQIEKYNKIINAENIDTTPILDNPLNDWLEEMPTDNYDEEYIQYNIEMQEDIKQWDELF